MSRRLRAGCGCLAAFALLLSIAPPLHARARASHIRLIDERLRGLMDEGLARSDTFRGLVERLESEPILVYVRCEPAWGRGISAAGLNFLASTGSVRYVRLSIRCTLNPRLQLALLAHELQHALEVATQPSIVDAASLRAHYQDRGFETYDDGRHRAYETDAALAMQRRVDREVHAVGGWETVGRYAAHAQE